MNFEAVDLYTVYHLPKLRDAPYGPLHGLMVHLQLTRRAKDLGLISRSAIRAWQKTPSLIALSKETEIQPQSETEFRDTKASLLNKLLSAKTAKAIRVTSKTIDVDEPIRLSASGIRLDLGNAALRGPSTLPYLLRIENSDGIDVRGGSFLAGDSGILVNNSRRVRLSGAVIQGLAGTGIVVTNSHAVVVRDARISGLHYAGIILHRGVTDSLIEQNRIENNLGTPNAAAAILLTDREFDLAADSRAIYESDSYSVRRQALSARRHPPDGNLIRANELLHNQAGGIYSDGGVRNVMSSNLIAGNAREAISLDSGSISNVVIGNVVRANGSRWGEPDRVLSRESIASYGRLNDGTPAEKIPGISLDNALYNIVFQNTVQDNYGGGIKLVRTGLFNLIGMNTLVSNAKGSSDQFHFFGIEFGAAPGDNTTGELDITPSRGNIVFSNLIRGRHYSGMFFGTGSDQNDIFDNVVLDATQWALESASFMPNSTVNNLTNLPCRNISAGFDPNLFVRSRTIMDDPEYSSDSP